MIFRQILSGVRPGLMFRLLFKYPISFKSAYLLKVIYLVFLSILMLPLYLFEQIILFRRINKASLPKDVVFIIGHWRSGTTFLHNSLISTGAFHYLNTYQAFLPNCMYYGGPILKQINKMTLPEKRPMDNMDVGQMLPQEEEFAMACMFPNSFYHALLFPLHTRELADRYLFKNDSETGLKKRLDSYNYLIKKIHLHNKESRTILLKNPALTCRISELKKSFPTAKFIYLYRDEKSTLKSMEHMFISFLKINALTEYNTTTLRKNLEYIYSEMKELYAKEKLQVNNDDIIEINYSDLIASPNKTCIKLMKFIGCNPTDKQAEDLNDYLRSQEDYKTNFYSD